MFDEVIGLYEHFSRLQARSQYFYVFLQILHLLKLELELLCFELYKLASLTEFFRPVVILNWDFNGTFHNEVEEVTLRTKLKYLLTLTKFEKAHTGQHIVHWFVFNVSRLEEGMLT